MLKTEDHPGYAILEMQHQNRDSETRLRQDGQDHEGRKRTVEKPMSQYAALPGEGHADEAVVELGDAGGCFTFHLRE